MDSSLLGKQTIYVDKYSDGLIFPISRVAKRKELGIIAELPFFGYDIWNAYELSWLRADGKPEVAIAEIIYDCKSELMVESKSLKLYLNSFNNTTFKSTESVRDIIKKDLSDKLKTDVVIKLYNLNSKIQYAIPSGINIDDFYSKDYKNDNSHILSKDIVQREQLFTNLLKSNCPVTGQPDWATLMLTYSGQKMDYISLIKYIISLRDLNAFHEQCVEKIYMHIYTTYRPSYLEVYARYTRRGGIDINPYRCSENTIVPTNCRMCRQ